MNLRCVSALCVVTDFSSGRHKLLENSPLPCWERGGNSHISSLLQQQGNWIFFFIFFLFLLFRSGFRARLHLREPGSSSGRRQRWSGPIHYIMLHKAEPQKLVSLHLYSQRLKIHILRVKKKKKKKGSRLWKGSEHDSCSDSEETVSLFTTNIALKTREVKQIHFVPIKERKWII